MTKEQLYNRVLDRVLAHLVKDASEAISSVVASGSTRGAKAAETVERVRIGIRDILTAAEKRRSLVLKTFEAFQEEEKDASKE